LVNLVRARTPLASRRYGDEGRRARLSVDKTGRKLRARPSELARRSGECSVAAKSIRSNFALRLEHELQTVVDGSAGRRRDSLNCSRVSAKRFRQQIAVGTRLAR
jgi:hypothetical protein